MGHICVTTLEGYFAFTAYHVHHFVWILKDMDDGLPSRSHTWDTNGIEFAKLTRKVGPKVHDRITTKLGKARVLMNHTANIWERWNVLQLDRWLRLHTIHIMTSGDGSFTSGKGTSAALSSPESDMAAMTRRWNPS
jgi:hypothetical protein